MSQGRLFGRRGESAPTPVMSNLAFSQLREGTFYRCGRSRFDTMPSKPSSHALANLWPGRATLSVRLQGSLLAGRYTGVPRSRIGTIVLACMRALTRPAKTRRCTPRWLQERRAYLGAFFCRYGKKKRSEALGYAAVLGVCAIGLVVAAHHTTSPQPVALVPSVASAQPTRLSPTSTTERAVSAASRQHVLRSLPPPTFAGPGFLFGARPATVPTVDHFVGRSIRPSVNN